MNGLPLNGVAFVGACGRGRDLCYLSVLSTEFWVLGSEFWVLGSGLPQQWTAAVYCNIYWKTQQRMQSTATDSVRGLLTFSITAQRECQFPPLIYIWIYIQDKYCIVVWGWCGSDNECSTGTLVATSFRHTRIHRESSAFAWNLAA